MLTDTLNPPEAVGQLGPAVLTDLHTAFPDQSIRAEWYRDANPRHGSSPALLEALQPLQQIIMNNEVRGWRSVPWGIYYQVDTQPVRASEAQRFNKWHVDGDGQGRSIVVADALPTEFLVKPLGASRLESLDFLAPRLRLLQRVRNLGLSELSEAEIQDSNLVTYQPQPYELAHMRGHIHRSPLNHSEQTIARTWIRAAILRRQPSHRS